MDQDAKLLMDKALERYIEDHGDINILQFSRQIGVSYSNVYQTLLKNRMPNCNMWWRIMNGLGAVKVKNGGFHVSA